MTQLPIMFPFDTTRGKFFFLSVQIYRGHLFFRLAIMLVNGLSKHTTRFACCFLHFLSFFCLYGFSKICQYTKETILNDFCIPKQCTRVHGWGLKTTLIIRAFCLRGWYPTQNTIFPLEVLNLYIDTFCKSKPTQNLKPQS